MSVFSPDYPLWGSVFVPYGAKAPTSLGGLIMTTLASVVFVGFCLISYAIYLKPALGGAFVGAVAIAFLGFFGLLIAPMTAYAGYWVQMHYR